MTRFLIPIFLLLTACLTSPTPDPAPPVRWVNMQEALSSAAHRERMVLVNVYTDWCEFCRKMDQEVYPDSTVRATINRYFETVRLNAESADTIDYRGRQVTQADLARELGIKSYPTVLVLDAEGTLILQINGYMPAADFDRMLRYLGSEAYRTVEFTEFAYGPDQSDADR